MAEVPNANYDMRRQSRGVEPQPQKHSWRKRAFIIGVAVIAAGLCIGMIAGWWHYTHVRTVTARVQATVVALAPVVDARLLELHVTEGQRVKKGELLARLDETEIRAALEAAEAALLIRKSEHARAKAQCDLVRSEVETSIEQVRAQLQVASGRVDQAAQAIVTRQVQLSGEIEAAQARCEELRARLAQLKKGVRAEIIQSAQAKLDAEKAKWALYQLELEQSRKLAVEGIDSQHLLEVRRTQVITQEKAVKSAELELIALRAGATPDEVQVATQALACGIAGLALARAGTNDIATLEAALRIRKAELRETEALLKRARGQVASITVAEAEAQAAEAQMRRAEADVKGRRAILGERDFISPVDGVVTRRYVRVGEVCRKGVTCILVTDDSTPRWIEGFVREADAMLVSAGQPARVRVPANTGHYVDAVVEQVGLHTDSQDDGESGPGKQYAQKERVWVRIRPLAPLEGNPVTGTSARGIIRVRRAGGFADVTIASEDNGE
jgi:multidrug resistance efflux pump